MNRASTTGGSAEKREKYSGLRRKTTPQQRCFTVGRELEVMELFPGEPGTQALQQAQDPAQGEGPPNTCLSKSMENMSRKTLELQKK